MKVTVILTDGEQRVFDETRCGGSYTNSVKYEIGYVVIADVWGKKVAFPNERVKEVITELRRW